MHLTLSISIVWRKVINDSLGIVLNNFLKTRIVEDRFKDHSRSSLDVVYGTKYIAHVISWILFMLVYRYIRAYYFIILASFCLISVFTAFLIDEEHQTPEKFNFINDLSETYQSIRDNKLITLTISGFIYRAAPSFVFFFDFYLKKELGFDERDFSFKYLARDILFWTILFLMNKVFTKTKKGTNLKIIGISYLVLISFLIFLID